MEIKTEAGYDMPGGEEICLKTEHFQVFADIEHRKEAGYFSELLERNYFKIQEDFHFPLRKRSVAGQDSACGEEASEGRLRCYLCSGVPGALKG